MYLVEERKLKQVVSRFGTKNGIQKISWTFITKFFL